MKPLGISAYRVAEATNVLVSQVQDILHDRRKITVDTSFRLAKVFGVSDYYFLDIQRDITARIMSGKSIMARLQKALAKLNILRYTFNTDQDH